MPLVTPPGASAPLYARNKITGETYFVGSNVNLLDDLGDVDTSTTGPTGGNALIWDDTLGQWVPGVASTVASLDDLTDVTTSATGPSGPTGPADGQVLLWDAAQGQWVPGVASTVATLDDLIDVSTSVTGPTGPTGPPDGAVLVWDEAQGLWVPGPGASEIETSATLPTGTSWELWVDTAPVVGPGGGGAGGTVGIDDLIDVDTATVAPVVGDTLLWGGTVWAPGAAAQALDDLTDVDITTTAPAASSALTWNGTTWVPSAGGFLPLSGGTITGTLNVDGDSSLENVWAMELSFNGRLQPRHIVFDDGPFLSTMGMTSGGFQQNLGTGLGHHWIIDGTTVATIDAGGVSMMGVQSAEIPDDVTLADIQGEESWKVRTVIAALLAKVDKLSAEVAELRGR